MEKQENSTNAVLNAVAAARYLGLSASTLAKWRVSGGGPLFLKLGRRVVYRLRDLEKWQEGCTRRSTSDLRPRL